MEANEQVDGAAFFDDERAFFDGLPVATKIYFAQGRRLHDTVFRLLTPEVKICKPINRRVAHTVLALLAKGLQTFRGIELLATAGLSGDAQALLRSLFEAALAATWILERDGEREQRAIVFSAHELHERIKMLKALEANKKLGDVDLSEEIKVAGKSLDRLRDRLPDKTWTGHWSGLGNTKNVAEKLDALDWYDTVFRFSSSTLHANALWQLFDAGGEPGIDIAPDAQALPMILAAGSEILWSLAMETLGAVGLETAELAAARPTRFDALEEVVADSEEGAVK